MKYDRRVKVHYLPEQHTDFVFSWSVDWTAISISLGVAAVVGLLIWNARRRRRSADPRREPPRS
jgi:cell division protein FtsW (lipid II flippase)